MFDRLTILDALDTWSSWHSDSSPLGTTGDYALDMQLADAFRALLYRPSLNDRLDWLSREIQQPKCRARDDLYHAEIIGWWLDLFEAAKTPVIESRINNRSLLCAIS